MGLRADSSPFLFAVDIPGGLHFSVQHLQGEYALGMPYQFDVDLVSTDAAADDVALIGLRASIFFAAEEAFHPYSGIITFFEHQGRTPAGFHFRVRLEAGIAILRSSRHTRIFVDTAIDAVVSLIMFENGFEGFFKTHLNTEGPKLPCIVQYQESDLDFISRIVHDAGLRLLLLEDSVDHSAVDRPGHERLLLSDDPEDLPRGSDIFWRGDASLVDDAGRDPAHSIHSLRLIDRLQPSLVQVKDVCDDTPDVDVSARSSVKDGKGGCEYLHDLSCADVDAAIRAAQQHADAHAANCRIAAGIGSCSFLRAGMRFGIVDHPRSACNGGWLATRVQFKGGIASGNAVDPGVQVSFEAVPAAQGLRYIPDCAVLPPRVEGLLAAYVEGGSDYARIDEQGRYRVRLAADIGSSAESEASPPLRMLQPHAGKGAGMHFPLRSGTPVMLAFVNGDPARPVIVGALPDADHLSPVLSGNNRQNVIRSGGGTEICLDDTKDAQILRISTPGGFSITLDDGKKQLKVQSSSGHSLLLDDNAKKLSLQTAKGIGLAMDDSSGGLSLHDAKSAAEISFDGSGSMQLSAEGDISIAAGGKLVIEGSEVTLQAKSGVLGLEAAQDLSISGMNVALEAKSKAALSAKTALDLSSAADFAVSAAKAEMSAKGPFVIAGKPVKIN